MHGCESITLEQLPDLLHLVPSFLLDLLENQVLVLPILYLKQFLQLRIALADPPELSHHLFILQLPSSD